MAEKRDYYEVLGVSKTATDAEIKSAFRKQAKTCHPDLHPGDKEAEARFKELNEAAEVLSDPDKRAKYDQYGHAAFDPSMGGGQDPFSGFSGFGGFSDIFDSMFGGGFGGSSQRSSNGPVDGNDLRYNLTITFEEAAFGAKKEITIPREENCSACGGSGAKAGTQPVRCPTCGGTGQVRTQQNTILGSFTSMRPCTNCKGTGKIIKEPCEECRGAGRVRKSKRIVVNIPAGIDSNQQIIIRDEGEAGKRGGARGNLYVAVTVKPHKLFRRKGSDLYYDMLIPYTTAVLGGEISVPTLTEPITYSIPAGTQAGTTLRIREQGMPKLHNQGKGDMLLTVNIDVPKKLTDEQQSLLEQLAVSFGATSGKQKFKKSIFSKLRED